MQKKKNSLVLLLGFLLPFIMLAQNITLDIEDVNTCTSNAEVDITTSETTELTSIQFSMTWDDPGLSYSSFSNLIFTGTGTAQVLPGASNTLNFFWFWDGTNTFTLNPGDVLFTIDFNVTGTVGDVHNISFCDPGCTFGMEARGVGSILIPTTPLPGSVTVGSTIPSITCPNNISLNNDPGSCGAIATWTTPIVVDCDNNTTDTPVSNPVSGTLFPIGTTPVDITVQDDDGNMTSCTFNVTVTDSEAPTITCSTSSISVNVPQGTASMIVSNNDLIPTTADNCNSETLSYVRTGATNDSGTGDTNGLSFNLGSTTVTYTVTDGMQSNTCSIIVELVEVTQNPITLAAIGTTVACDAMTATAQIVVQNDVLISAANFTVEWDPSGLTYQNIDNVLFNPGTFNFGPNPSEPHAVGNQLTFAYVDFVPFMINAGDVLFEIDFAISGNSGDCFNVFFFDNPNPPPPAIVFSDPSFNSIPVNAIGDDICLDDLTAPSITCPIDVTINCGDDQSIAANGNATATDDCDSNPMITSGDVFTSACGNSGSIARTFTATDASGKSSTCVQTITINRAELSDISAPVNYDGFDQNSFLCTDFPNNPGLIPDADGYLEATRTCYETNFTLPLFVAKNSELGNLEFIFSDIPTNAEVTEVILPVSYTHLTLPTTPYV